MGQRQHSLRKMQVVTRGNDVVCICGNFPSGAAEDGSFDPLAVDSDGYLATPGADAPRDGYGAGFKGVIRTGAGSYDLYLDRVYAELLSASGSVHTPDDKLRSVQFTYPLLETMDPSGAEDVSLVRIRLIDDAGARADLQHDDRVSFTLFLRLGSAGS